MWYLTYIKAILYDQCKSFYLFLPILHFFSHVEFSIIYWHKLNTVHLCKYVDVKYLVN